MSLADSVVPQGGSASAAAEPSETGAANGATGAGAVDVAAADAAGAVTTAPGTGPTDITDGSPATSGPSPRRWVRWAVLGAILVAAFAVRIPFFHIETLDYSAFLSRWYSTLDQQGFSAFATRFADYNYPYLYLIWGLTVAGIPSLIGIKALSVAFDLLLAFFAYRIVGLRTDRFWVRALAFGLVALLPSVVANSAYWGQADSIYSAFAVGGVYFLLRATTAPSRRAYLIASLWACAFFGLALSFKLQAIFVLPVLGWLLLRRRIPWYALLVIPAVFVALVVPAVLAGAPWSEALSVYLDQTDSYKQLTLGAANLYQLIPIAGDATWLAHLGIAAAAAVIVVFYGWSLWKRTTVNSTSILVVATASAMIVPFLLPAMHDRYFFTAEILSVVLAFYLPLWFAAIPVLVQASAIGIYHSSLTGDQGQGMSGGFGRPGGQGGGPGGAHPGAAGGSGAASGSPTGGTASGTRASGTGGGGMGSGPGGGGRPDGGSGGGPGGSGQGRGGDSGYTSGRGDTALTVYATFMGLAVLGVMVAVRDTFRRTVSK